MEFNRNLSVEHYNRIQWTVSNMTYPSGIDTSVVYGHNIPLKYTIDITLKDKGDTNK